MIVWPYVNHSVPRSPSRWMIRAKYTSAVRGSPTEAGPWWGYAVSGSGMNLSVRDGALCFDGVDVTRLAARVETPFFLYSERLLRENVAGMVRAFRSRHRDTDVFYASKACSNLWVLNVVRDAGACVEVNSGGELEKALRAGFAPDQIVFNGVAKTRAEIERAVACGARALMVDSMYELERIAEVAGARGVTAAVAPRIDVHVSTLTHPGLQTAHGGKSGIDRDDTAAAFRKAAADPRVEPVGLHVHVGSQITGVEPYRRALTEALDLVAEAEAAAGTRLRFLNAGGGFAVPYREESGAAPAGASADAAAADYFRSSLTPDDYAETICGALEARRPDLALYVEPGRSVAAATAVLVTRVENEKTKGRRDAFGRRVGDERWLTIDAGFNTLLEHTNYDWYFRSLVANRAGEPVDTDFRLAGPLCDGGDVFAGDDDSAYRRFPAATTVGDIIVFLDAGAYTLEMMNPYNARPRAAAWAIAVAGDMVEIRRRESDDDLSAHDLTPGFGG